MAGSVVSRWRRSFRKWFSEPESNASVRELSDAVQRSLAELAVRVERSNRIQALAYEDFILEQQLRKFGNKYIARHNTHVFSQAYEDTAISEIFARIGSGNKTFVEIGVENGAENTTRLLLALGWRGLWIEGNETFAESARRNFRKEIACGQLQVVMAMVEPDNVQQLLEAAGFGSGVDFLSLDIDQHTSHVFRALKLTARAACIEYNAHFPPAVDFEVPYVQGAAWDGSNWFGASLKTISAIAEKKDMVLVGCDLAGTNCYLVHKDQAGDLFPEPFTAEHHYQPPRFDFIRSSRGHSRRTFAQDI
jgi:hypothetical protein